MRLTEGPMIRLDIDPEVEKRIVQAARAQGVEPSK
jgi:hypothetical protein